jgi:uncharacterized Zn ribbon protein
MTQEHEQAVDAFGTPIERGDTVIALGDPKVPARVTELGGTRHLTVRLAAGGTARWRTSTVRNVTIRDAAGTRLAPGDVVQPITPAGAAARLVESVIYGAHLITLAADEAHPEVDATLPALVRRIGCSLGAGDQVVDEQSGALYVVFGRGREPGFVSVEPVYGGARRDVARARLRRVLESEHGVHEAGDGRFVVPALGDDLAALDTVRRIVAGGEPVGGLVPLPRASNG